MGIANGMESVLEESPLPQGSSRLYADSIASFNEADGTVLPDMDSSSAASTPMALMSRRGEVLPDGAMMTLREQENVR